MSLRPVLSRRELLNNALRVGSPPLAGRAPPV
jgi:hypothetical protein